MDAKSSIRTGLTSGHGGSTDAALHLPAIARECGIDFVEIFKKTPYAAGLKPGGRDAAKDMVEIGGIPLLDADAGPSNVKLTGTGRAERKTKWKARETNHTSDAPGVAHEKQCYADI